MFNGFALTHIITIYYTVRTMHDLYFYQFLSCSVHIYDRGMDNLLYT